MGHECKIQLLDSIVLDSLSRTLGKGEKQKAATIPSQEENSLHHHIMLSVHQQYIMNTTRMATILS